jgi:hypothetical protein
LEEFSAGVSVQTFPKTIRDAIKFTQSIGLKWLWVDAFCIVQDNLDDWNNESSKTCDVYQNAFVTLAALGASGSNDGLFSLRDPLLYLSCDLFNTYEGKTVVFRHSRGNPVWPLHQRRWVIQERILPSRTLGFGPILT